MSDNDNVDVLEGSAPTQGGIVARKKKDSGKLEGEASLLGLNKLTGKPGYCVHECQRLKSTP